MSGPDALIIYPGSKSIITKLVADRKPEALGAQIIGMGEIGKRIEYYRHRVELRSDVDSWPRSTWLTRLPSLAMDSVITASNVMDNNSTA